MKRTETDGHQATIVRLLLLTLACSSNDTPASLKLATMSNWHMPSTYDAGGAMGSNGRAANGATVTESGKRNNLAGLRKLKLRMPRTREHQGSENITEIKRQ